VVLIGYYQSNAILACDEAGITTYLPRPLTSNNMAQVYLLAINFKYLAKKDEYRCPAGERMIYRSTREESGYSYTVTGAQPAQAAR